MIPLDDMAIFVEVSKALSIKKAAQVSGIPSSTISRRIHKMEKIIGLRLFNRTTRNIELTEAGRIFYKRCKPIIEAAKIAHEQLGETHLQPNGEIRALLPVDFTTAYIAPILSDFCKLYPDITYAFDMSSNNIDMLNNIHDLAISVGEPKDSNFVSLLLGHLPGCLYASPKYLEEFGEPKSPEDLAKHECLSFLFMDWNLQCKGQTIAVETISKFKVNSVSFIRKLVALNMGIGLFPEEFVAEEVKLGKLVKIMSEWQGNFEPVYVITEYKPLPSKTKIFINFLKEKLNLANQLMVSNMLFLGEILHAA